MAKRDIIVIGASAGGIEALKQLVSELPGDFPAIILIVVHVHPHSPSLLPKILTRAGKLEATHPRDDEVVHPGTIYVAPPGEHLILQRGYVNLTKGAYENHHRPAIDPLFRSAARAYGPRVIGILLSGMLDDGTAGFATIKARGGLTICQDPEDALFPEMPRNAIENVEVDHIVPLSAMPELLTRLIQESVEERTNDIVPMKLELETEIAEGDVDYETSLLGKPSEFACPACGGVLWEVRDEKLLRFRCRVGHAYSAHNLLAHQDEALEDALWAALRALQEKAALARRMADRAQIGSHAIMADRWQEEAAEAEARAKLLQQALLYPPEGTNVRANGAREEPEASD